jgi:hypothetical protein
MGSGHPFGVKKKCGLREKMIKKEFFRKLFMVGIAVFSFVTLAACGIGIEANTEDTNTVYDNTPKVTQPLELTTTPTETPTATPTSTPTETQAPTPTVDPAFTDEILLFEQNMQPGDVVWSMLKIEEIVNAYDSNGNLSFQEYISKAQENIEGVPNYGRVNAALEEMQNVEKLTSLKLAEILKNNFSELDVIDLPEWPNENIDLVPEFYREQLDTKEFDIFDVETGIDMKYHNQYAYLTHLGLYFLAPKGALSLDLSRYYTTGETDLLITIDRMLDDNDLLHIFTITVGKDGKIKNIHFNFKYREYYFNGSAWFILSRQDPYSPPDYFNE